MPSETIWSRTGSVNGGSPIQSNTSLPQYKTVLDQVDPEVARLFNTNAASASIGGERRFSFNDGSDIDSTFFGLKKGSLSAITAPVGGTTSNIQSGQQQPGSRINFGTASISGGIASRHPPQDSFLQKFSSVADATREIELTNGLSKLGLENPSSRRTSFNSEPKMKPFTDFAPSLTSPHGSLNENLNMPASRASRHQSISEKIDHYNSTSPIQASAALSINSDLNEPMHHLQGAGVHNTDPNNANNPAIPHNFWNPATATSFTPALYNYLSEAHAFQAAAAAGNIPPPQDYQYAMRGNPNMPPLSPPLQQQHQQMPHYGHPFMPQPQFIDPGMYNMMGYPFEEKNTPEDAAAPVDGANPTVPTENASESTEKASDEKKTKGQTPGIGLMGNRQIPPPVSAFMFHPFNPYQMYQQYPPPLNVNMMSPTLEQQQPQDQQQQQQQQHKQKQPQQHAQQQKSQAFEAPVNNTPTPPPPPPSAAGGGNKRKKNGNANGNAASTPKNGGNHIYRSPLLEEVRSSSKSKEYYLKDIYGHAVEFTKDQYGSRFIQQKLSDASEEEKEAIFNEIRDISYELMTDVFGNYVIQKYFEHGSYTQKQVLLESMIGHIYELSLQMYGCRVIQRALEEIDVESQIRIVEELKDYVLFCSKDQNGNHVIQKSIERIPFERIRFILDSLNNQIYHLSTHPYGCRVIQRLLEFSDLADQQFILDELNRFIFYLIQDQYGNYVMQHILERGDAKDREEILKVVLGSVVNFSKHKFASNVIEKCIKYGTLEQRRRILHEVMLNNEDFEVDVVGDDSPLALMMKDQFANYVIQKLVEGFDSKSEEKRILIVKLRQYLKQISSKNSYGKHLASVEKMIIVAETAIIEAEGR